MIKIKFVDGRQALEIDAGTISAAVKNAVKSGADLRGADLRGADVDFSFWPLWCGSLDAVIDKRIFCQLLYHTMRAGKSVDDPEVKRLFDIPEVVNLANQFHRVDECGKIEVKGENNGKSETAS